MDSYLKSEKYRLLNKRGLYLTGAVSLALVLLAVFLLAYSLRTIPNFLYGTNRFLYLNVLSVGFVIVAIGLIMNLLLTGKDMRVVKQSVSFGISRRRIFLTKLGLTLRAFLLLCGVGVAIVIISGETLLENDGNSLRQFLVATSNMLPLVVSGIVLGHTLVILQVNETFMIVALAFIYGFSHLPGKIGLYFPANLLNNISTDFHGGHASFELSCWLVGGMITLFSLTVGLWLFNRKNIK